ncbi:protein-S-isoprenylcysteine O-methyltransferase Ste14 [Caulobacter ginsengisoli]|uniref:Protein-S-isoprenylcysteine O-methyltransferase Ste14 n=1 Tax=Caulobacter ginsengisoli TaxID=400775 RepID=A0ABU0IP99_9CAUL|nr:methyltransferase [Caulobacter ginsengisoli]MDQ0463824.1 protein-S-isoprenylcysteine O-methyltransferase Ste14 [Caulobacter ginsengisoli]
MTRNRAILGSIAFFLLAPGIVGFAIPAWISGWRPGPLTDDHPLMIPLGLTLVTLGLLALIGCFVRFALQGEGTPAPMAPTQKLVVEGLYRHVRNPMYLAVLAILLGQALALANLWLLVYAAVIAVAFAVFVKVYEEPTLRGAYPEDWPKYAAAVPAWLPRRKAWTPDDKDRP